MQNKDTHKSLRSVHDFSFVHLILDFSFVKNYQSRAKCTILSKSLKKNSHNYLKTLLEDIHR